MSLTAEIRPITPSDFSVVRELFDELDRLHREHLPWRFREPEQQPRPDKYLEDILKDDDGIILVAVENGKLVGFVHAVVRETPDFGVFVPQRVCVVDNIHVAASRRRSGIGRDLLEHVEAWAKERGSAYTELMVYEFNSPAQRFFESAGYSSLAMRMVKRS